MYSVYAILLQQIMQEEIYTIASKIMWITNCYGYIYLVRISWLLSKYMNLTQVSVDISSDWDNGIISGLPFLVANFCFHA